MGSYLQVNVGCPFYRGDDGTKEVVCEGMVGGPMDSGIKPFFRKKDDFLIQIRGFCFDKYKKCPVYIGLMIAKYDEEE